MRTCSFLTLTTLVFFFFIALSVPTIQGDLIENFAFKPPFEKIDKDGKRLINDTWSYGGNTEVKKNFIRLTTDRQNKKGYIWQKKPLGRDTFSAILTFRISGIGKKWFGDGIGLWLTNHQNFILGPHHGFTDKFTGIGIIIDTFNNPEHKGGHKDVSIHVNDGTKSIDTFNEEKKIGCDAQVRFHEGNALFDPVHSASRIKIKIEKTKFAIEVDYDASGHWIACHEMILPFASDWLTKTTIGITGATGALADNHDILRFDAFTDFTDTDGFLKVDSDIILHGVSKDYKNWMNTPGCGEDCLIAILQKELSNFRISAEHRFTDLKEKTEDTVNKLKKQEKNNEERVQLLEQQLERILDTTLDATSKNIGHEVHSRLSKTLNEHPGLNSSGWKTPFFLLFLGLCAGGFMAYRKYQALMKSHLL
jgi:mannose-binding lectin 2